MIHKNTNGVFVSTLLTAIPGLIHGFSTKQFGDQRKGANQLPFLSSLGLNFTQLHLGQQTHGKVISVISAESPAVTPIVDGLICEKPAGGVALGVHIADCAPLLFVDPNKKITGTAHAGWKGTYLKISTEMLRFFTQLGSNISDVRVAIGPRIGMCCYNIPQERADLLREYAGDERAVCRIQSQWHLDIGYINFLQLVGAGVAADHIDISPMCTSCQETELYSFRRDSKQQFGEMMGVVSWSQ